LSPAIYGIPAYTMKGIHAEIQKQYGASTNNYIIAARTAQGLEELQSLSRDQRAEIVNKWLSVRHEIVKKKYVGEDQMETVQALMKKRKEKREKMRFVRKRAQGTSVETVEGEGDSGVTRPEPHKGSSVPDVRVEAAEIGGSSAGPARAGNDYGNYDRKGGSAMHHARTFPEYRHDDSDASGEDVSTPISMIDAEQYRGDHDDVDDEAEDEADLEEAIRQSIALHSEGNREDDEAIERALRASMAELQKARAESGGAAEGGSVARGAGGDVDEKELEEAMKASMQTGAGGAGADGEEMEEAMKASIQTGSGAAGAARADDEEEMKKAIAESQQAQTEEEKQRREEDIVMEYVKKQSLMEEEHRRKMNLGRPDAGGVQAQGGEGSAMGAGVARGKGRQADDGEDSDGWDK